MSLYVIYMALMFFYKKHYAILPVHLNFIYKHDVLYIETDALSIERDMVCLKQIVFFTCGNLFWYRTLSFYIQHHFYNTMLVYKTHGLLYPSNMFLHAQLTHLYIEGVAFYAFYKGTRFIQTTDLIRFPSRSRKANSFDIAF